MPQLSLFATRIACAICIVCGITIGNAQAAAVSSMGSWESTLQTRYLTSNTSNGPDAYFDSALNITWLANTRLSAISDFGVSSITQDGRMSWDKANEWVTTLNSTRYLGYSDWRLPQTYDFGTSTYSPSPSSSEMAHLYYTTLGNPDYFHGPIQNTGPFLNLPGFYWSSAYADIPYAAYFNMYWGNQQVEQQTASMNVLVVRSGDTLTVPEPASHWLVLAGLLPFGILVLQRRR